jgi:hypothetical protein
MSIKTTLYSLALVSVLAVFSSCSKDESMSTPTGSESGMRVEETTYELHSVVDSTIYGTATFKKVGNKTKVTIELEGTPEDGMHPAHIHYNSAEVGGGIAVSLNMVDGESGKSVTIVDKLDDGTPISYEELLMFNGYINVHLSMEQLNVIVAQGNIGSNAD